MQHQQHQTGYKRRRGEGDRDTERATEIVADHYNRRPNQSKSVRNESKIIHLRNLNNWVKSVLINKFTSAYNKKRASETTSTTNSTPGSDLRPLPLVVLDLCCGKGGDLSKWKDRQISHIVLADVAETSVEHARQRYNEGSHGSPFPFSSTFIAADCFEVKLDEVLPESLKGITYDFVSCQFSLHYSFNTEQRAKRFFYNVSSRLKVGGYFLATLPNTALIKHKLHFSQTSKFGNELYSVEYVSPKSDLEAPFGSKYIFFLTDAVDHVPEYFVNLHDLHRLCSEVGLELTYYQGFEEFYNENKGEYYDLLRRMKGLNEQDSIRPEEWQAFGIYMVVVFRKTDKVPSFVPESFNLQLPKPKLVQKEEIITIQKKNETKEKEKNENDG